MNNPDAFKKCSLCGFEWPTRDAFLEDPALELIGYQVNFEALKLGFFMFNHICKNTLSVRAGDFWDLYNGPVFKERATGGEQCPEYCLHQDVLDPCPAQCECAFVREILQVIKTWPKKTSE
jgi:hypothetical protein